MSSNPKRLTLDKDVYVLTDRGTDQIRGTATALTPAEIELLVCIDGRSSVGDIRKRALSIPAADIEGLFSRLVQKGLLQLAGDPSAAPLDISALLNSKVELSITDSQFNIAAQEAASGVSSLQEHGYYVRIARRAASKRERPKDRNLSAIVIEDEPYLAKFLRTYLVLEKFDARIASTREEIIAEFRRPPLPDLVLLDVMLPDADGFDILLKMRQHPALRTVPIIMLTAQATRESVLKGLAGGADGYMTKPFEVDNLIATIKAVLGLEK